MRSPRPDLTLISSEEYTSLSPILVFGGIRHTLCEKHTEPVNKYHEDLASMFNCCPPHCAFGWSCPRIFLPFALTKDAWQGPPFRESSEGSIEYTWEIRESREGPYLQAVIFSDDPSMLGLRGSAIYFYIGHQQGEYQYCNRGFSHVENEYLTNGRVPANPKGYDSFE
jgi:hypothetical protein